MEYHRYIALLLVTNVFKQYQPDIATELLTFYSERGAFCLVSLYFLFGLETDIAPDFFSLVTGIFLFLTFRNSPQFPLLCRSADPVTFPLSSSSSAISPSICRGQLAGRLCYLCAFTMKQFPLTPLPRLE